MQKIKTWFNNNRIRLSRGWKGAQGSENDESEGQQAGSDQEGDNEQEEGVGSSKAGVKKTKAVKKKTYSARDVAMQLWSDKIKKEIGTEHNLSPADDGFIGKYNTTLKDMLSKAKPEELKELEDTAELWNKQEVPEAVKQK